ncbi:MAG TPA: hypothetical protein PLK61_12250, partial [Nitrosomonas sp.]|nr:hypothetical protein [Nitrosomonas sp.]
MLINYLRTDEQGKLFAQTCKIDAGYAFHDVEDKSSPAYRVTQAMPFKTQQRECDYVPFAYFPRNTQAEFVATLADIIDTPPQDLGKFFHRDGAQALKSGGFATRAIAMLKARQLGLKTAFADELAAYHTQLAKIKQKEIKSDFPSLPPEVQPLYAQSLLESSNLIFQQ